MLEILKHVFLTPTTKVFGQVPRALVASILAAGIDFLILVLLVEQGGWHPIPAACVGYLAGGLLQYVLCVCWIFPAAPPGSSTGFVVFTLMSLAGLGITWAVVAVVHGQWGIPYGVAKVMALGLAFSWNFLSRKYLLFRSGNKHTEELLSAQPAAREEAMAAVGG